MPLDKDGRKTLKDKRAELERANEANRPQMESIKRMLGQLNTLRYWTRKVIPEALPENYSFGEELDTVKAKRELNDVIDKAITALVAPPEDRHTEPVRPEVDTDRKPNR